MSCKHFTYLISFIPFFALSFSTKSIPLILGQVFDCRLHGCSQDLVFPVSIRFIDCVIFLWKVAPMMYFCWYETLSGWETNNMEPSRWRKSTVWSALLSISMCSKYYTDLWIWISLLGIANQVTKAIANSLILGTEVRKKCPSQLFLEWWLCWKDDYQIWCC